MIDASLTSTITAPASAANAPAAAAQPPAAGGAAAKPGLFDNLLSELNPLQYVPVVGIIYRAVTGDTIPESARFAGSLVVSGLMGGPVGIGINVGTTMLEHLLGIDQEKIGDEILAAIGIGGGETPASTGTAGASPSAPVSDPVAQTSPAPSPAPAATGEAAATATGGWSPAQLAAYGVGQNSRGVLTRGSDTGADVLNGLELAQIAQSTSPGDRLAAPTVG